MMILLAWLIYPGLGLLIVLTLALWGLTGERALTRRLSLRRAFENADGVAALASLALALAALALTPWPLHPALQQPGVANLALIWAALTGAVLLPQLAGLLAQDALAQRAVSRDMQISIAGLTIVVLALATLMTSEVSLRMLPGRLLTLLGGIIAVPAASGLGPFAPERSLSPRGAEQGLDEPTAGLLRFVRAARGAVMLGILAALAAPPPLTMAPIGLLIALALYVSSVLAIRVVVGLPRLTLASALRWCWHPALILTVLGMSYTAFVASSQ